MDRHGGFNPGEAPATLLANLWDGTLGPIWACLRHKRHFRAGEQTSRMPKFYLKAVLTGPIFDQKPPSLLPDSNELNGS